jgi:hypothetical protein
MQDALTSNVQSSIRPGAEVDTYYYGDSNSQKQIFNCIVNTKFTQEFTNRGAGTSSFTISPYQGVSDIVCNFTLGAGSPTANLPQGWGYSLINQVSVRYGSSAQYFFTGAQMYLENLYDCENGTKRDALSQYGGNALVGAAASGAYCSVYIKLPHNSPRVEGKPFPFPSDLLVQPIVITIQLNDPTALASAGGIWVPGAAGGTTTITAAMTQAQLQVKQEMMADSADLLARRVNMNESAYTFPLMYFPQQQVDITLNNSGSAQTVNLTGFRAGEVQRIMLWLTKAGTNSTNGTPLLGNITPTVAGSGNLVWAPLSNIVLTYNGEIFYRADGYSNSLWSLTNDSKTAYVNAFQAGYAGGATGVGTWIPYTSEWVEMPFSQAGIPYDKEVKLLGGKPILNAVVNLQVQTPTADTDYVLHVCYFYNASLLCSRGGAEYIF